MKELEMLLAKEGIRYSLDMRIADRSSFKIGGIAAMAIFPSTKEELCFALLAARNAGVKFEVIGNGTNILFAFERYNGALIFTNSMANYYFEDGKIYAECGTLLSYLSVSARQKSLSGLEFTFGIPARVGGAIVMNAGAHGFEMSNIVEYTEAFDVDNAEFLKIYDNRFGYRTSIYLENPSLICLGACLSLRRGNEDAIRAKMDKYMEKRTSTQPHNMRSAGSYFKRPEGDFAGRLIEECGLKGFRIGGAEVSPEHAGFIVNVGGATFHHVLALEEKIKESVMSRFGVELQREVRLIED